MSNIEKIFNLFFASFFKLFTIDLKKRLESKSVQNQINNNKLFIDFFDLKNKIQLIKSDLNPMFSYIEFKINATHEKTEKTYLLKSLKLFNNFKKSDYMKNTFIKNYLNDDEFKMKFSAMFIDENKKIHDVSLNDYKFIRTDLIDLKKSQISNLKYVIDYLIDAHLETEKIKIPIAKKSVAKKSESKKSESKKIDFDKFPNPFK